MGKLDGKKVAILLTDGFEQVEMVKPKAALEKEGAKTTLISPKKGSVQGFNHFDKADSFPVELALEKARAEDFDALLLPGGAHNPDALRAEAAAVDFTKAFFAAGKPVAAICHGPWVLVEADVVKDRTLTSWPSIQTDIRNAGGNWVDAEVVVDQGLVTSRKPDDIPAFNAKMIEEIAEGVHQQQRRPA